MLKVQPELPKLPAAAPLPSLSATLGVRLAAAQRIHYKTLPAPHWSLFRARS
jgi:hypothetical protein